jgi:acyl CoA:acetate/3-ketoacid CoA transferase
MVGGTMAVEGDTMRLRARGTPKFVERLREVTFNGPRGLAAGKRVFYATPVGLFRLTDRGMELARVMPGIDVRRDILDVATMPIVLPAAGTVPVVPRAIVTGEGFAPRLGR